MTQFHNEVHEMLLNRTARKISVPNNEITACVFIDQARDYFRDGDFMLGRSYLKEAHRAMDRAVEEMEAEEE